MTGGAVARRYARALADVAAGSGELEGVQRELGAFADVLRERRELAQFLRSPSVPKPAAAETVERVAEAMGLSPLARRFLRLVLQAGRLPSLEDILQVYGALADERLGRLRAEVTTAAPLPEAQLAGLRERLGQITGKQVYLTVRQDPAILGGVVTRIGSQVYDGSLRAQLARLHEKLLQS
ncbi:MAG: ATP synthase F1 subunit delta [Candidatus Methylomirabilales bacterium]